MEISYRIDFVYIMKLGFCSVKLTGCIATEIPLQNKSEHYCSVSDMVSIQKQPGSLKKHGVGWESVTTSWPSLQPYSRKFNFTSSNFINLEFMRSAHIWCIKAKQMLPQCVSACMGLFGKLFSSWLNTELINTHMVYICTTIYILQQTTIYNLPRSKAFRANIGEHKWKSWKVRACMLTVRQIL